MKKNFENSIFQLGLMKIFLLSQNQINFFFFLLVSSSVKLVCVMFTFMYIRRIRGSHLVLQLFLLVSLFFPFNPISSFRQSQWYYFLRCMCTFLVYCRSLISAGSNSFNFILMFFYHSKKGRKSHFEHIEYSILILQWILAIPDSWYKCRNCETLFTRWMMKFFSFYADVNFSGVRKKGEKIDLIVNLKGWNPFILIWGRRNRSNSSHLNRQIWLKKLLYPLA